MLRTLHEMASHWTLHSSVSRLSRGRRPNLQCTAFLRSIPTLEMLRSGRSTNAFLGCAAETAVQRQPYQKQPHQKQSRGQTAEEDHERMQLPLASVSLLSSCTLDTGSPFAQPGERPFTRPGLSTADGRGQVGLAGNQAVCPRKPPAQPQPRHAESASRPGGTAGPAAAVGGGAGTRSATRRKAFHRFVPGFRPSRGLGSCGGQWNSVLLLL